jgi:hypothetical protein
VSPEAASVMEEDYVSRIKPRPNPSGKSGVRPVRRGITRRPIVVGFDIETDKTKPFVLSASCAEWSGDGSRLVEIPEFRPHGLETLLDWLLELASNHDRRTVVAGAHNLKFDLGLLAFHWQLAYGTPATAKTITRTRVEIEIGRGRLELVIGNVVFGKYKRGHVTIHFVDTLRFFVMKLEKAVAALGLGEVKTEFPGRLQADFGQRRWPLEAIGAYCIQDSYMARLLLEKVMDWTMERKIMIPISAPHMSARIFQKEFVRTPWVRIPRPVRMAAMLAYHGGRNLFCGEPGWYPRLNYYDVNSAYTWAMTQMPSMDRGEWRVLKQEPPAPGQWGFVQITGIVPASRVPIVYTHGFNPVLGGSTVTKLWITSMEYDALRAHAPAWSPKRVRSLIWLADSPAPSDLACYAQTMWDRRASSQTVEERTFYKLMANSLYGKFIQRTPDEHDDQILYEGGLFYPPIASWITALVRCRIITNEFAYDVLHTATDGILTPREIPTALTLGGWKLENVGPALILRNKLYLHWDEQGHLKKYALHGFQGTLDDLHRFVLGDDPSYHRKRLRGWAEAIRDEVEPFGQLDRTMRLRITEAVWDTVREEGRQEPYRSLEWTVAA